MSNLTMTKEMSKRTFVSGLSGNSGTYNVRENEMLQVKEKQTINKFQASDSDKPAKIIRCTVVFLDDSRHTFAINKLHKGQALLDLVFEHLEIIEKDYFGVQYIESSNARHLSLSSFLNGQPFHANNSSSTSGQASHENNSLTLSASFDSQPFLTLADSLRWLDSSKSLKKQLKGSSQYILFFRVKFYVSDPSKLQEEYTRYHFFLQLRKDILDGRLLLPSVSSILLASYAAQSEIGDYNSQEHTTGYLSKLRILPTQSCEIEKQISELHQLHKGQTPADAEFNFLDHAKRLDMYGVDLYQTKDSNDADIQLGVSSSGILVFQNGVKINTFCWAKIIKISFKRKKFFIQLRREGLETFDNMLGFNMLHYRACKNLWKSCVEHHTFFRLESPKPQTKKFFFFFNLGSKFRYSGKTEYQTLEEGRKRARTEKTFQRLSSRKFARQTVPNIVSPSSTPSGHLSSPSCGNNSTHWSTGKLANGSISSRLDEPRIMSSSNSQSLPSNSSSNPAFVSHPHQHRSFENFNTCTNRIQISEQNNCVPRRPWTEEERGQDSTQHKNSFGSNTLSYHNLPYIDSNIGSFSKESSLEKQITSSSSSSNIKNLRLSLFKDESPTHGQPALIIIVLKPDEQGRFGFNVKGGADQNLPVLVSRVAPNTPADSAVPKLNEGDQVMSVNGNDVENLTHDQVVKLIRSTKDNQPEGELVLTIRPLVYDNTVSNENDVNAEDEPPFQYIPVDASPSSRSRTKCDRLLESIMLLSEGLDSGGLIIQFEQLYRKKPGETMDAARLPDNLCKNRYRDISPYDSTRVILKDCITSDYVNASFVNMEIPRSGIVNRYIATQGPLATTCEDFWQMVWEQKCSLIVMVTPLKERGRIKCHKYWPESGDTDTCNHLSITTVKEEGNDAMIEREFKLINNLENEERDIIHLQYLAWPDHGVPDEANDFLDLIFKVRHYRSGLVDPIIVHCSAGIGRTGVLILMETALCLIEANEPIYPLEILKSMRDQRAMLIQTSSQFKFVLEAILKVYKEDIVKPSDDYNDEDSEVRIKYHERSWKL